MARRFALALILGLALAAAWPGPAAAREAIRDFRSEVTVEPNGDLLVSETLEVQVEGREIKRGIVREFPTVYRDRRGNTTVVGFDLVAVERDGSPEAYHLERRSNGVAVYVGSKEILLEPGVYTYHLTYRTDSQVGFFPEFDELYWNVTGNGWRLPILRAQGVVVLPPGGEVLRQAAYTGPAGAQGRDYVYGTDRDGNPTWTTTRPLREGEGLTVAVAWPKGLVAQPTPAQEARRYWSRHRSAAAGLAGLFALLVYYLLAWFMRGRDPRRGTIIPLFSPPAGVSPAAARFITRMGFDDRCFAAAVVDMAVKGYLTISQDDNDYTLSRIGRGLDRLSRGEAALGAKLFGTSSQVELETKNHRRIGGALEALKESLQEEHAEANFRLNRLHLLPGVLITLLALVAMVWVAPEPAGAAGIGAWLTIWCGGCYFLATRVVRAWQAARGLGSSLAAVGATLFALPFFLGAAGGLFALGQFTDTPSVGLFLVMVGLTPLFAFLLKAPTMSGRQLMDRIEGFRLYLAVAEGERLGVLHPPERTPELFERYLPYALALGVEQEWSERFAAVLERAGEEPYQPAWYHGAAWSRLGSAGLVQSLGGSLAGAVASSSSAPGSSSGSGGGGSSGGGGGGGGGGGW